jgi:hypothetical protein
MEVPVTLLRSMSGRLLVVRGGAFRRVVTSLIVSLVGIVILSSPAHAYLDPGTGNVMLQLLLAGLAGVAAVAKLYWAQIVRFLRGRRGRQISDERPETGANRDKRQS